jgi:hypothetical protein
VPWLPGVFFALTVAIGAYAWVSRDALRVLAAFAFTLLGWFLAVRIAIEFSDPIRNFLAWKISTKSGPAPLFPGHEYYTIAVIGVVSGAAGAFLTALGLSLIRQRGEAYDVLLVRMVCFGALAGALLECIEKPSGKSPLHIDSALPLFLIWQSGIATIAAYHLSPKPDDSGRRRAASREPIQQDIDRSAGASKEQLLQTMAVAPNSAGPQQGGRQMTQQHLQSGPSSQTAYILNVILPGAGNIYFGQPIVGTVFVLGILFAVFIGFFGASAAMLGIVIILISLVAAIFTFGLSLLALPIGLVFLMMGSSS